MGNAQCIVGRTGHAATTASERRRCRPTRGTGLGDPRRWWTRAVGSVSRRHEVPGSAGARPSHARRSTHAALHGCDGHERRGVRRPGGAEPVAGLGGRCRHGRGPAGHGHDAEPVPSTGRLRPGERRAGRRPAAVLAPGVDRPPRLLPPHPAAARRRGRRDEPAGGHWDSATSGSPTTAGSRRARRARSASGGWRTSPTAGRRPPSSVTAASRARGSCACTGSAWATPSWTSSGLHTAKLHRELGLNVAMPVLPLHGPRKVDARERRAVPVLRHDEHRPRA